jgi:hypothetical protein
MATHIDQTPALDQLVCATEMLLGDHAQALPATAALRSTWWTGPTC